MKFALIMYACSVLSNQCGDPLRDPTLYNTHKECAMAGYIQSITVLDSMDSKKVNDAKLYFSFSCKELDGA